jgi:hypothetical protein
MRLVGSDNGLKSIELGEGGTTIDRQKDGTFHVDQATGKALLTSGDFAVAGTNFQSCRGWVCNDCHFVGLFQTCKCGSTNTVRED